LYFPRELLMSFLNADIARDELTFYEHIRQRTGGWSCMLIQLLLLRAHEKAAQLWQVVSLKRRRFSQ
jgi:hypothetical protein